MKNLNGLQKTLLIILLVVTCLTGFLAYRSNVVSERNKQVAEAKITANKAELITLKNERASLSKDTIYQKIEKDKVNVSKQKQIATDNVNDSMKLVFDQTKSKKDYEVLKDKLPEKVGKQFTKPLLQVAKPSLSQSGVDKPNFDGLDYSIVSMGNYNYKTNEVPMTVVVSYNQKVNTTPSGIKQKTSDKTTHTKLIYHLMYNLKSNQYTYDSQEIGEFNK